MIRQKDVLRVLVADGSSHARLVLEDILTVGSEFAVNGLAADGDQMLQQLKEQEFDVVLASASLGHEKQLLNFKRVFSERPTPIVMLVEKERLTLELLKEAIDLGVFSLIVKPGPAKRPNYRTVAEEIRQKVRAVRDSEYWAPEKRLRFFAEDMNLAPALLRRHRTATAETIVVIGASTGGTQAVEQIVRQLDPELDAAVLIALHLPPKFTHSYTRRLKELTTLSVIEGRTGLVPKPGKVIVAPGGRNMVVQKVMGNPASLRIGFLEDATPGYDMPSIDQLMRTVAASGVRNVVGVILTGMGKDGTAGASAIALREGGHVIAQDEASSAIFGMAKSAIDSGYIDKVLPLSKIAAYLNRYVAEQQQQVSTADSNT